MASTGSPTCEHRVVARDQQRSPAAVYEDLAPAVLGYFRAQRMRDPEGLTGDVFVAVTEKLAGFRGDDHALRRWVFTIAHHRRVDEIRRVARRPETVVEHPTVPPTMDPTPVDPALVRALDRLTPDQRDVVVLRYVVDLAVADVAKVLGKRAGAVKMLQARALTALADDLGGTSPESA
ncbi:RNA polymerase sigma factor [Actinospongicola halichondriae]|uniref:RNA polymerase sigma factor n=1 Tax=Actinospongicola halichondriae TaxID=3236844 RepID=UPI003D58E738